MPLHTEAEIEEAREKILEQMLAVAPFDGWTPRSLDQAISYSDLTAREASLAFPNGVRDLVQFWSETLDDAMRAAMTSDEFKSLKIREKVAFGINARLAALAPYKEAARRAAALLATPFYADLGAKLSWATSDSIWRGLGDKSTDFNYYSKRAILNGVWLSTFAKWLGDESETGSKTQEFLAARIDNVMQIEKVKAAIRKTGLDPMAPISMLAKLRFRSTKS